MPISPEMATLRARLGAHALHAQGKTNTGPANAAFRASFEKEVDPDGTLDPAERAKRAEHAYKAHMARLSLQAAKARRAKREGGGA
jgi:hypothetical protein